MMFDWIDANTTDMGLIATLVLFILVLFREGLRS